MVSWRHIFKGVQYPRRKYPYPTNQARHSGDHQQNQIALCLCLSNRLSPCSWYFLPFVWRGIARRSRDDYDDGLKVSEAGVRYHSLHPSRSGDPQIGPALLRRERSDEFLEARIIPERVEHWIKPEQCRSERHTKRECA